MTPPKYLQNSEETLLHKRIGDILRLEETNHPVDLEGPEVEAPSHCGGKLAASARQAKPQPVLYKISKSANHFCGAMPKPKLLAQEEIRIHADLVSGRLGAGVKAAPSAAISAS